MTRATHPAELGPGTLCVHGAGTRKPREGLVEPIVRSSTFVLDDEAYALRRAGKSDKSRVYARETNPTVEAVERRIAVLEGAERALLFSSGMAAMHAVFMTFLRAGDHVVCARQIYGGSVDLLRRLAPLLGFDVTLVDLDSEELVGALGERTRMLLCESISNPLTTVADLPALRRLLDQRSPRAMLVVDATLASPIAQRPLAFGADLVHHSATKVLGGHSDLIAGALAGGEGALHEVWEWRTRAGGCLDPEAAYLIDRGLKTMALRVRAQSENALAVAGVLERHPRVERVHYCGLEGHVHRERARRLLRYCGGVLSFVVRGGDEAAWEFMRRLEVVVEAPSLGGVESLVTRPRDLSHAGWSEEERVAAGLEAGLVRMALGIEEAEDLVRDVERALG